MNINLTQVIHNVKEAYVDLTGDTDDITYGNISTKISEIQTGGGITGGYTVKFKVDGNDYYIASCQQGESITEPPTPTSQTGTFTAWQLNGVDVAFPYTPSADVELTAQFSTVRTEMEVYNSGTELVKTQYKTLLKTNNGLAICGSASGDFYYSILIAETSANAKYNDADSEGTKIYNGQTWYYCYRSTSLPTAYTNPAFYDTGAFIDVDTLFTKTLDHYFYKD